MSNPPPSNPPDSSSSSPSPPPSREPIDIPRPTAPPPKPTLDDYKAALERVSLDDFKRIDQVPCMRNAFMYAIGGAVAVGAVRFVSGRNIRQAWNWTMGSGLFIAVVSWQTCRTQVAQERERMRAIQERYAHRHISQSPSFKAAQRRKADQEGRQEVQAKGEGEKDRPS